MDTKVLPEDVDCLIIGTGLINSIVAAACSRIGKSVLHVDKNDYYGDQWASFTLQQLIDWIKVNYPENDSINNIPQELLEKSRLFCIDLCPKLLNSNGDMVNLLVQSNVTRYHEFKNNIRILSVIDDQLQVLPCQRSEVFLSPLLDLVDKRRMMKFFELCAKYEPGGVNTESKELEANADLPISQFLVERNLKHQLRNLIIDSIAMVSPQETTKNACEKIKSFMTAIERYGRSPFLFPIYGCGEFPQSFCRLSAVFGGIYCLKSTVKSLEVENIAENRNRPDEEGASSKKCKVNQSFLLRLSDHELPVRGKSLVIDRTNALDLKLVSDELESEEKFSRAILITQGSIKLNPDRLLSFLRLPESDINTNIVYIMEVNSSVMVCPHEYSIIYLWSKSKTSSARGDLGPVVDQIISHNSDLKILWNFYYQRTMGPMMKPQSERMDNLYVTNPPSSDIDYSHCIKEAEQIFLNIYPDQQFLPRAPDPDEIIM